MKPISEVLSRYKTIAAASRAFEVAPKLLHENIERGALVEPDGTIWIRSKTKLKVDNYTKEDKLSGWISVNDRLPKDDEQVVAAKIYEFIDDVDAAVCFFANNKFIACEDALSASNYDGGAVIELDIDVTHWMPLPEAPK